MSGYVHKALQGKIELRPPIATNQPGRHLVGYNSVVLDKQRGNVIRTGHVAMNTIERSWLWGTDVRSYIIVLYKLESQHMPLLVKRTSQVAHSIGAARTGFQMLQTVFTPAHRATKQLCCYRHQGNIRVDSRFDAV